MKHALRMNRTGCCAGTSSLLSDGWMLQNPHLWILVALPLLEVQLQLLSQLLVPCEQIDLQSGIHPLPRRTLAAIHVRTLIPKV